MFLEYGGEVVFIHVKLSGKLLKCRVEQIKFIGLVSHCVAQTALN